jgi:hypothetical protein
MIVSQSKLYTASSPFESAFDSDSVTGDYFGCGAVNGCTRYT